MHLNTPACLSPMPRSLVQPSACCPTAPVPPDGTSAWTRLQPFSSSRCGCSGACGIPLLLAHKCSGWNGIHRGPLELRAVVMGRSAEASPLQLRVHTGPPVSERCLSVTCLPLRYPGQQAVLWVFPKRIQPQAEDFLARRPRAPCYLSEPLCPHL